MKVICMLRGRLYHENRHEKVCVCARMCVYMHTWVHGLRLYASVNYTCVFWWINHILKIFTYTLIFPTLFSVQATTRPLKESWQKETEKQRRRRRRGCCWFCPPSLLALLCIASSLLLLLPSSSAPSSADCPFFLYSNTQPAPPS